MTSMLNNGLTGIRAAQIALSTASNNVANAGTEGYTRQRVNLVQNPSTLTAGGIVLGTGVSVAGIERIFDIFLVDSLNNVNMTEGRASMLNNLSQRLDGFLGNPDLAIGDSIQRFFDQAEILNRDTTSPVARQQLITEGETLVQRFQQVNTQLASLGNEVNLRLRETINTVNRLAGSIAELNGRIASSSSATPNGLLDQREVLLNQLAVEIDFTAVRQADGPINILVGSGQPLVLSGRAFELTILPNEFDSSRAELAYNDGSTLQLISDKVNGGKLAGLLEFRNDALDGIRNQLGQLALGLAEMFNAQHQQGTDLNGDLGTAFFGQITPLVTASAGNTGTSTVTAAISDPSAVVTRELLMRFDGAAWQFFDAGTGGLLTPAGTGTGVDPFIIDGMSITTTAGAVAGDKVLVQALTAASAKFSLSINDPAKIAAAGPISAERSLANLSDSTIEPAEVTDIGNPNLRQSVDIVFDDATTYRIFDNIGTDLTGPLAYTDAGAITFNGWTTQIKGTPETGDTFSIKATSGNSGDNRNAIALTEVSGMGFFSGGQISLFAVSANLVSSVGSLAARSSQDVAIQSALREQIQLDIQSVSGVNLDEEAINLLQFQEAFLAASRVISIANSLFQTLINELR